MQRLLLPLLAVSPIILLGFSTGPAVKRTGAQVDGGLNCTACHGTFRPANSDTRGSVRIEAAGYVPGVKQTIRVTLSHPEAARWGFQLTARMANDETSTAGTFTEDSVVRVTCDNGTNLGAPPPCQASQLQFAEHSSAPRTGAGAGFTFNVEWTPPSTNVGDIVFYAAGNAADGTNTNLNDRIYTTVRRISAPCSLTAKPALMSALNGASFAGTWNAGALMSIFGSNFGPAGLKRSVTEGDVVSQRFPQSLACIAVMVNGQNAPLVYVQPDQINFQAPALTGVGPATVLVIANPGAANEVRSDPFNLTTQRALAPALFTFDGKTVAATSADGTRPIANSAAIPGAVTARPGDIVVLYGTGMGPTNPAAAPGDIVAAAADLTEPLTVTIGGTQLTAAEILYKGLSPQSISGLNQLNVRLPATLPDGDLPVIVSVGGVPSASGVTIPVRR